MISKELQKQADSLGIDRTAQELIEEYIEGGLAGFIPYKRALKELEPKVSAIATSMGLDAQYMEGFDDYVSDVTDIIVQLLEKPKITVSPALSSALTFK